ncbi:MAG: hypothetical protein WBA41_07990, partial [Rivularia sp. (in: cyanobacteria)]
EQILAISPIKYRSIFQPEEILKRAINQEISWKSIKQALFSIYEFTQHNSHNYLESAILQFDSKTRKNIREILPKSLSKLNHSLTRGKISEGATIQPQTLDI